MIPLMSSQSIEVSGAAIILACLALGLRMERRGRTSLDASASPGARIGKV